MESITRNVRDLTPDERRSYEAAVGHALRENQQLIIQVIDLSAPPEDDRPSPMPAEGLQGTTAALPEWCNVYGGLTDEQIRDVEGVILERCDLSRQSP